MAAWLKFWDFSLLVCSTHKFNRVIAKNSKKSALVLRGFDLLFYTEAKPVSGGAKSKFRKSRFFLFSRYSNSPWRRVPENIISTCFGLNSGEKQDFIYYKKCFQPEFRCFEFSIIEYWMAWKVAFTILNSQNKNNSGRRKHLRNFWWDRVVNI